MSNYTQITPHVAAALARDHQRGLIAQAERAALVAQAKGGRQTGSTLRATVGATLMRAGGWVAGRQTAPALVREPAR